MSETIQNRYEFILYYDVVNGNPNGDPDAGNMPRIDPQTGHGIVTDVCLKRKVRNYIEYAKEGADGYDIFVTEGAILNNKLKDAYENSGLTGKENKKKADANDRETARQYMCNHYYDVRTFGAVMDTGDFQCGQVRGPVQLCFSKSADAIFQQEITITRMAATKEDEKSGANRTMGRKYVVPYGLYRAEGYISAKFAEKTGFNEDDLQLFFDALKNMFDHDHSAARGSMNARKLIVFKHDSALGNAPAHILFESVHTSRENTSTPPRDFKDYQITIQKDAIPDGVTLLEML